jgi:RNA polymerase sigma factor for flagellar operon FliA
MIMANDGPTTETPRHELAIQFSRNPSPQLRSRVVEAYQRFVQGIAARVFNHLQGAVGLDDLISEGNLGLMEALGRYDHRTGYRFDTFAHRRVHGTMIDFLRRTNWRSKLNTARSRKVAQAVDSFTATHGRPPNENEIRKALRLSAAQWETWRGCVNPAVVTSIDSYLESISHSLTGNDRVDRGIEDAREFRRPLDPQKIAENRDEVRRVVKMMSLTERAVFDMYYLQGMTMKHVGEALSLSESRISQMIGAVKTRVRRNFKRLADSTNQ